MVFDGDYPLLDFWRKYLYPWLRQGSAALIGVFVFGAFCADPAHALSVKNKAKACLPPSVGLVEVSDGSHKPSLRPRLEGEKLLDSVPRVHVDADFYSVFYRLDRVDQFSLNAGVRDMRGYEKFRPQLDVFSDASPLIITQPKHSKLIKLACIGSYFVGKTFQFYEMHDHFRPMGSHQSIIGNSPHFLARPPQSPGECGNKKSGEGREEAAVFVNKPQRAQRLRFKNGGKLWGFSLAPLEESWAAFWLTQF